MATKSTENKLFAKEIAESVGAVPQPRIIKAPKIGGETLKPKVEVTNAEKLLDNLDIPSTAQNSKVNINGDQITISKADLANLIKTQITKAVAKELANQVPQPTQPTTDNNSVMAESLAKLTTVVETLTKPKVEDDTPEARVRRDANNLVKSEREMEDYRKIMYESYVDAVRNHSRALGGYINKQYYWKFPIRCSRSASEVAYPLTYVATFNGTSIAYTWPYMGAEIDVWGCHVNAIRTWMDNINRPPGILNTNREVIEEVYIKKSEIGNIAELQRQQQNKPFN